MPAISIRISTPAANNPRGGFRGCGAIDGRGAIAMAARIGGRPAPRQMFSFRFDCEAAIPDG